MSSTLTVRRRHCVSDVASFQVLIAPVQKFMPSLQVLDLGQCPLLLPMFLYSSVQRNRDRIPGPLTLRMMLREVSSMNSTRTWVTPPREPEVGKKPHISIPCAQKSSLVHRRILPITTADAVGIPTGLVRISTLSSGSRRRARTGAAENTGHLDELDGLLAGIHLGRKRALSSWDEGGEGLGGLDEEAGVKINSACVGSKLREGSGLSTPQPSGIKMSQRVINL